jgi:hypothetical protein
MHPRRMAKPLAWLFVFMQNVAMVASTLGCDTPQQNDAFIQLLIDKPPVGINLFSLYNGGKVPDARTGYEYDIAVGSDSSSLTIEPFPYDGKFVLNIASDGKTATMTQTDTTCCDGVWAIDASTIQDKCWSWNICHSSTTKIMRSPTSVFLRPNPYSGGGTWGYYAYSKWDGYYTSPYYAPATYLESDYTGDWITFKSTKPFIMTSSHIIKAVSMHTVPIVYRIYGRNHDTDQWTVVFNGLFSDAAQAISLGDMSYMQYGLVVKRLSADSRGDAYRYGNDLAFAEWLIHGKYLNIDPPAVTTEIASFNAANPVTALYAPTGNNWMWPTLPTIHTVCSAMRYKDTITLVATDWMISCFTNGFTGASGYVIDQVDSGGGFPWTTPQQNDEFLSLLVTNRPVGINIGAHYDSVTNKVPDARGNGYDVSGGNRVQEDSPDLHGAVNPVTSWYGGIINPWTWPALHIPSYTRCWVRRTEGPSTIWVVECFANTSPVTWFIDQIDVGPSSTFQVSQIEDKLDPEAVMEGIFVHSAYTWDNVLSDTNMKIVTKALRKEIGGTPYGTPEKIVVPISDLRAYRLRFLIALRPPQSINIFADLVGTTVRNRMGPGFEVEVTAGTAALVTTTGPSNGANNAITVLGGGTSTKLLWPINSLPEVFTTCNVQRYSGATTRRILTCESSPDQNGTPFLGHWNYNRGMGYYHGWKTQGSSVGVKNDWLIMCGTSRGSWPSNIIIDQLDIGINSSPTNSVCQLNINYNYDTSDFEIHSVYIWNAVLTPVQMRHVTAALRAQIGGAPDIANNAVGPAVVPMPPALTAYEQVCWTVVDITNGDCPLRVSSPGEYRYFHWTTRQQNDEFLELLVTNPPVGINIGAHYDSVTNKVPDARGNGYDVSGGNRVQEDSPDLHGAVNPVTSWFGDIMNPWTWPALHIPTYTRCLVMRSDGLTSWVIDCWTNTSPVKYVLDQVVMTLPVIFPVSELEGRLVPITAGIFVHSAYTWDTVLSDTDMKIVTLALRKEIGQISFGTSTWANIMPISDLRAYRLRFLIALRPPQSINIFADLVDTTVRNRMGSGFEVEVIDDRAAFEVETGDGAATLVTTTGPSNGANNAITVLGGGTSIKLLWPENSIPLVTTVCSVSRYASSGTKKRVFNCQASPSQVQNWLHGHWSGRRGVCHYRNWQTSGNNRGVQRDWLVMCSTTGGTTPNNFIIDQYAIGTRVASLDHRLCRLNVNYHESSDFEVHSVYIWDAVLNPAQMKHVASALRAQIGGTPDYESTPVVPMIPSPTAYEQVCPDGTNIDAVTGDCVTLPASFPWTTPQQNDEFLGLLLTKPPVGINIFSHYDTTTGKVPDARGNGYDVTVALATVFVNANRIYPPTRTFVWTSENYNTLVATFSLTEQSYGNGGYTIRASSKYTSNTGAWLVFADTSQPAKGHWDPGQYSSGVYIGVSSLDGSYKGDWVTIKHPAPFVMKEFRFVERSLAILSRMPGKFKIYGRNNDDDLWTLLYTQSAAPSTFAHDATYNTATTYPYSEYGMVVSQLRGSDIVLNFLSFEMWGTEPVSAFNAVNPVTYLYGGVLTTWTWPTLPSPTYTRCWVTRNDVTINWLVACLANTNPFTYIVDQTNMAAPSTAPSPVLPASENYVHSTYTWDVALTEADMKLVTMALRKEIGGIPYEGTAAVVPISDLRAYYLRFLLALRPAQSINIFSDLEGSTVRNRVGIGFEVQVTAGTATKVTTTGMSNGANNNITVLQGTTATKLLWPENSIPSTMTICSVSRYTGDLYGRIFSCMYSPTQSIQWIHGHHDSTGRRGVAYYNGWNTGVTSLGIRDNWLIMCGNSRKSYPDNIIIDQFGVGINILGNSGVGRLNINYHPTLELANFEVHSVYIWNAELNPAQMKHVTSALRAQIGGTPDYEGTPVVPMIPSPTAYEQVCADGLVINTTNGDCYTIVVPPSVLYLTGVVSEEHALHETREFTVHSTYTWDHALTNTEMKVVTAGIRKELGGVPLYQTEAVIPITDPSVYQLRLVDAVAQTPLYLPEYCMVCPLGSWVDSEGDCNTCAVGMYSSTVAATTSGTCLTCLAGTYSATPGMAVCTSCVAGTYSSTVAATTSGTCNSCPAGTYSATPGMAVCTSCVAGTYSAAGGATTSSTCNSCPAGTYSNTVGAIAESLCIDCPVGTWSSTLGATTSGTCTSCVAGTYSSTVAATASSTCNSCQAGKYSNTVGAIAESTCIGCPVGTRGLAAGGDFSTCDACNAGTYNEDVGRSDMVGCDSCPAGTYRESEGATSIDDCIKCQAGKYSAAEGATASSTCDSCPVGTYSNTVGAPSSVNCIDCLAGQYSLTEGATASSTCDSCPVGTYSNTVGAGTYTCISCPAGTYGTTQGMSVCTSCLAGTYSASLGATSSSTCLPCLAGSYGETAGMLVCTSCFSGKYSAAVGANSWFTCDNCGRGKYSTTIGATDSSTCDSCPAGTFSFWESAGSLSACIPCPVATYSTTVGATDGSTCDSCPVGTYSTTPGAAAASNCIKCAPGTYGATPEMTICTSCVAGKYSTAEGATASSTCDSCPVGTYSDTVGEPSSVTCIDCSAGKYSATLGVVTCLPCPIGMYSSEVGATSFGTCTECALNTYNPSTGAPSCLSCGFDRITTIRGATSAEQCILICVQSKGFDENSGTCVSCVPGTYSDTYDHSGCQICPVNTVSPAASNELIDCICDMGLYGPPGGLCAVCSIGSWCSGGTRYTCPAFSSSVAGSSELTDCICEAGKIGPNGGPCQSCTADEYCPGGTESFECTVNTNSPTMSSTVFDCICDGGYQGDAGGPCSLCPSNTYCASGHLSTCPIHTLSSSGSDELVDCSCKQGYYGDNGGVCVLCPTTSFCTGGNSIQSCNPNSMTLGGSNTSMNCICNAGWYGIPGSVCMECEPGSWCHAGVKTHCPTNSTTETGADTLTDCVCVPGFKGLNGATCSVCTTNTWCLAGVMHTCTANSYSPPQSSVVTACICHEGYTRSDSGLCNACAAGTHKNTTGDASCTACGVSTYSVSVGAVSEDTCSNCPTNTFAAYGSDELTDCICLSGYFGNDGTACTSCTAGTYKENYGSAVCIPCKVDTYSNTTAANSPDNCLICPGNTFSVTGSTEITHCTCKTGYTGNNGTVCMSCAAGTYKNTTGSSVCTYCDVGTYSTTRAANLSETCLICPWNNSHSELGSNKFTDCTNIAIYAPPVYTTPKAKVTFEATLAMNISEFTPSKRTSYVAGIAFALRVAENTVEITSVTERVVRRRRLLTAYTTGTTTGTTTGHTTGTITTVVETTITIAQENVQTLVIATTSDNLNRVLIHSDILVDQVYVGEVVHESIQWMIIIAVVSGVMLVVTWSLAAGMYLYGRCKGKRVDDIPHVTSTRVGMTTDIFKHSRRDPLVSRRDVQYSHIK